MKSDREDCLAATERRYIFDRTIAGETLVLAGIDEVGRGPLAGPVVAAAVVLDPGAQLNGVNDSKKLSPLRRERLYDEITASAREWSVGSASPEEIDRNNILKATFLAMTRALEGLSLHWDVALVDGNQRIPSLPNERQKTVVGGDAKSASIAAASIIAKVTRDRWMMEYHRQFPEYGFDRHKGYGTAVHREGIRQYGLSPIHRKSFCSTLVLQTTLEL